MKILVINGVNLNMLGKRKFDYGCFSLAELESKIIEFGNSLGAKVDCVQSNFEGAIVEFLQGAKDKGYDGVVLNAGAFSHYSYAIRDAIEDCPLDVFEAHISNVYAREEEFRHSSVISKVCVGVVSGLGIDSYTACIMALINGSKIS